MPSPPEPKAGALVRIRDGWRRYRTLASAALLLSAGAFVVYRLCQDWPVLKETLQQANLTRVAWSVVALMAALGLVAARWWLTLRALGYRAGLGESLRIWFLSQASRHVPGGIWTYVARLGLAQGIVPDGVAMTSLIAETLLRVASEAAVSLVVLLAYPTLRVGAIPLVLGMGTILTACLIALHPMTARWLSRVPGTARVAPAIETLAKVGMGRALALVAYYIVSVLATGLAFCVLASSFYPISGSQIPSIAGALAAAVLIGFLTPIAPSGLGVREGVLSWLLSSTLPGSIALMLAVLSRAWLTVGEAIWVGIALPWHRAVRRRAKDVVQR